LGRVGKGRVIFGVEPVPVGALSSLVFWTSRILLPVWEATTGRFACRQVPESACP